MKMTLREVQEHFLALTAGNGAGARILEGKVFPSKMGYAISRNIETLEQEANRINKQRIKLCEQYANKDEDGKPVKEKYVANGIEQEKFVFTKENEAALGEEYEAMLREEIELSIRMLEQDIIDKCEESDRYDIPTIKEIRALLFMIG